MNVPDRAGEHRVTVAGAEVRYLRFGAGRTLLLLHTLRTQLEYFRPLLAELDAKRLDILALDLPGHGQSSAPRVEYTADYFADAVGQFLDACDLRNAIVAGDSIGGTIGLLLAARRHPRVGRVIAVNPYDYGRWGGIRRSSPIASVVFTAMLAPGISPIVAGSGGRPVLRWVMRGGLYDPGVLPESLIRTMSRCGASPGHARAFSSLHRLWRTWLAARARYPAIEIPTTLVYGTHDWSRPTERDENERLIPYVHRVSIERCGHFASLEHPRAIADLLLEAAGAP